MNLETDKGLQELLQQAHDEGIRPLQIDEIGAASSRLGVFDGALRSLDRQVGNDDLPTNSKSHWLADACKLGEEQWRIQMARIMTQTGFIPEQTLEGGLEWPTCLNGMDVLDATWTREDVQFNHLLAEEARGRHRTEQELLNLPHMIAETEKADQKAERYVRWWRRLESLLETHPERERVETAMVNLAGKLDVAHQELSAMTDDLAAATWLQEIECHEL